MLPEASPRPEFGLASQPPMKHFRREGLSHTTAGHSCIQWSRLRWEPDPTNVVT